VDEEVTKRTRWPAFEFTGVVALAATLVALFLGHTAERYASVLAPPATETANLQPRFNAIDYATTASTAKSTTVVIGPCDTRSR
jgi:hypothetical protein